MNQSQGSPRWAHVVNQRGLVGIDVHGNVNIWNSKTAEITGYCKDEAMDKPLVSTFIVKKLQPSVQKITDDALQGIETSNYELEFRTKSKEIRYLLITLQLVLMPAVML